MKYRISFFIMFFFATALQSSAPEELIYIECLDDIVPVSEKTLSHFDFFKDISEIYGTINNFLDYNPAKDETTPLSFNPTFENRTIVSLQNHDSGKHFCLTCPSIIFDFFKDRIETGRFNGERTRALCSNPRLIKDLLYVAEDLSLSKPLFEELQHIFIPELARNQFTRQAFFDHHPTMQEITKSLVRTWATSEVPLIPEHELVEINPDSSLELAPKIKITHTINRRENQIEVIHQQSNTISATITHDYPIIHNVTYKNFILSYSASPFRKQFYLTIHKFDTNELVATFDDINFLFTDLFETTGTLIFTSREKIVHVTYKSGIVTTIPYLEAEKVHCVTAQRKKFKTPALQPRITIAVACPEEIVVFDLETKSRIATIPRLTEGQTKLLKLSPHNKILLAVEQDEDQRKEMILTDLTTTKTIATTPIGRGNSLPYCSFSPDETVLAFEKESIFNLFKIGSHQPINSISLHPYRSVTHCAFSPDSKLFAYTAREGIIQVMDVQSGAPLFTVPTSIEKNFIFADKGLGIIIDKTRLIEFSRVQRLSYEQSFLVRILKSVGCFASLLISPADPILTLYTTLPAHLKKKYQFSPEARQRIEELAIANNPRAPEWEADDEADENEKEDATDLHRSKRTRTD